MILFYRYIRLSLIKNDFFLTNERNNSFFVKKKKTIFVHFKNPRHAGNKSKGKAPSNSIVSSTNQPFYWDKDGIIKRDYQKNHPIGVKLTGVKRRKQECE